MRLPFFMSENFLGKSASQILPTIHPTKIISDRWAVGAESHFKRGDFLCRKRIRDYFFVAFLVFHRPPQPAALALTQTESASFFLS